LSSLYAQLLFVGVFLASLSTKRNILIGGRQLSTAARVITVIHYWKPPIDIAYAFSVV
jgi:hypothetical protein